jgi:hypothetical protein
LAVSRGTQNGPDLTDLAEALIAFQGLNSCELTLCARAVVEGSLTRLRLEMKAWGKDAPEQGAQPLVCAKSIVGYSDRRTVEAVIFQLMYAVDAELARKEMQPPNT